MEKSNSYFNCLVEISALSRNLVMHLKCNKLYTSDVFGNNHYIRLRVIKIGHKVGYMVIKISFS